VPVISVAYIAVAAGLLLGFGGAAVLGVALASVAIAVAAARRAAWIASLGALTAAGAVLASAIRAGDEDCARRVVETGRATIRLAEDLSPRKSARGTIVAPGCRVPARVGTARGAAPAGALIAVTGAARRNGESIAVAQADVRLSGPPGLLARWRSRAGRSIDAMYGPQAALARALLIADERDIAPEVRREFSDAGIIHMVSVSGLHVGVLAEAVVLLLLLFGVGVRRAEATAVAVAGFFVLFVGAPAPAIRAFVMYAAVVASRRLQRPTSPWALLALGAALPLLDPRLVRHIGYQLSVAGMAALIASGMLTRRLPLDRAPPWTARLARELIATVIASAVTAPIVAWHFGRLSLAAPLTNLAAAPLFAVAQPALFLSLAIAFLHPVAQFVADGTGLLLTAIGQVAAWGGGLPGAAIDVMPSAATAVAVAIASVSLVAACASRRWPRPAIFGGAAVAVSLWWPFVAPNSGRLELHVLDVGQGDAIALRTPLRRWIVVDAGEAWRSGDAGARLVAPFLRRRGGEVAALVLTHPHRDHIGGVPSLLRLVPVAAVYDGGFVYPSEGYEAVLTSARARGVSWRPAQAGDTLTIDGVRLRILGPDSLTARTAHDANDASVVVLAEFRGARILLTGDAERGEELMMVDRFGDELRADVLKVGHHGSITSSSPVFLERVRPRLGIVSVGAGNDYGHPSAGVLAELDARGVHVLRTDEVGSVAVHFDGRRMRIRSEAGTWELHGRG
jgi:competence protein ComEC